MKERVDEPMAQYTTHQFPFIFQVKSAVGGGGSSGNSGEKKSQMVFYVRRGWPLRGVPGPLRGWHWPLRTKLRPLKGPASTRPGPASERPEEVTDRWTDCLYILQDFVSCGSLWGSCPAYITATIKNYQSRARVSMTICLWATGFLIILHRYLIYFGPRACMSVFVCACVSFCNLLSSPLKYRVFYTKAASC